jgi:hypothetical protein
MGNCIMVLQTVLFKLGYFKSIPLHRLKLLVWNAMRVLQIVFSLRKALDEVCKGCGGLLPPFCLGLIEGDLFSLIASIINQFYYCILLL